MGKTILIIGAGAEQVPAYLRAKQRGYTIVASDALATAPAVRYADHFIHASTRNPEASSRVALEFNQSIKIDGVMTIANDVPLTVATVAQCLGLKSISIVAAQAASDKLLMKDLFSKHGVACPWYEEVKSAKDLEARAKKKVT